MTCKSIMIVKNYTFLLIHLIVLFSYAGMAQEKGEIKNISDKQFKVASIAIEGNKKTKRIIFNNEITFREGDIVSEKEIEESRQAIQNLGLFRRVEVFISDASNNNNLNNSTDAIENKAITFKVKERHYWLALPDAARSSDGDISYGGDIEFTNLWGLNQQLEIQFEKTNYDDGEKDDEEKITFDFEYPKIYGSDYSLDIRAGLSELDINEERGDLKGKYQREYDYAGIRLSKLMLREKYAQGLNIGGGFLWEDYEHDLASGDDGLYDDANIHNLRFQIDLLDENDYIYFRDGKNLGYNINISSQKLGSDKSYTSQEIYYQSYNSINPDKLTNFNYQLRLAYSNTTAFGDDAYDIGGGTLIRGFSRDKLEGDSYWLINTEYLTRLFNQRSLRGVLFADMGNISKEPDEGLFDSARGSLGLGLRWKLNFLVNTDLRFDTAFGIGPDAETRFYVGTRSTF